MERNNPNAREDVSEPIFVDPGGWVVPEDDGAPADLGFQRAEHRLDVGQGDRALCPSVPFAKRMDMLILDLEEPAAAKAMHTLAGLGLRPRVPVDPGDFAVASIREGWLHDKGMQVFSLFHPDNPMLSVDIFTNHPIEFESLFERSDTCDVGGVPVRVASIPALICLKRLADRPRVRDDIEKLENIARLKEQPR